ncbi:MAG: FHA domain-containing protein [Planctomycetaceae bacterium]|nr:FHA domain-containing protein [Planctomycetaceae bacterium]
MKVILRVERGEAPRKHFAVSRNTLIGRSNSCDLRLDSDDVSRRHCFLLVTDNGVWVRDLSSSNGTYVEGKSVRIGEDCLIHPGNHVKVGPIEFSVHFELERQPVMAQLGSAGAGRFSDPSYSDKTVLMEPETSSFSATGQNDDTAHFHSSLGTSESRQRNNESAAENPFREEPVMHLQNDDSGRLRSLFAQLVGWKKER